MLVAPCACVRWLEYTTHGNNQIFKWWPRTRHGKSERILGFIPLPTFNKALAAKIFLWWISNKPSRASNYVLALAGDHNLSNKKIFATLGVKYYANKLYLLYNVCGIKWPLIFQFTLLCLFKDTTSFTFHTHLLWYDMIKYDNLFILLSYNEYFYNEMNNCDM